MENKYNLKGAEGFWNLTESYIKYRFNGCGDSGWKVDIVPDTIYGVDISIACYRHDYRYSLGLTAADKRTADFALFIEICTILTAEITSTVKLYLAIMRAVKYYIAVVAFGGPAFNWGDINEKK